MNAAKVEAMSHERTEAMGRESIWRLLFRFSGPAIVASLINASYNFVDAIFVGMLGTESLAALAVAHPLMMTYWSIGMGIGVGAASLIARNLGAGKNEEVDRVAGCSITLFLIVSVVVPAIFLGNLEFLLRLFGADDSVLPPAQSYMVVETIFIPLNFFLIILAELVRVEGRPVIASVSMITSGVMNCIFDPILIWGLGPFPAFGIAGAAIATSIGRAIGATIIILHLVSGRSRYRLRPSDFFPNPKIIAEIYRVGVAMMVRVNGGSISQIIAARTASFFGVAPLAIVGVISRVSGFAFQPCFGLGQGMLPLVGYNFGARKKERVSEVVTKAASAGLLWGILFFVFGTLFSTQVMALFDTNTDYLAAAALAFRIHILGLTVVGVQTILSFFFQGIGARSIISVVISSCRQILFLIPCLLIMPERFGLIGLWAAYPVADISSTAFILVLTGMTFRGLGLPFRLRYNQSRDRLSDSSNPEPGNSTS